MRAYLVTIFALVVLFGSIAGYKYWQFSQFANADFSTPPVVVAAAIARLENRDRHIDSVGTIRAARGVDLTSETSGEVTQLNFDSGDAVTAGQLMIVLNDRVEQAARQNQIARLELTKILFERDGKLIKQKSIPQSQYDQSRADYQQARAQLAETEARLAQKRIVAPFSGTTGIRRIKVGDYVSPGTVITSLQDLSELEIDFTVNSQAAPLLKPGQPISVEMSAYPDKKFEATLFAIDSRVDAGTRNIAVRAKLEPGVSLVPGMFATLRVSLQRAQPVVTVPETAVTYSLHGNVVYVIQPGEQGEPMSQESAIVEVGEVMNGRVEILSGVEPGARVVTAGQNKLFRGAMLRVDESVEL